jgi:thymidylate kinase
MIYIVEGCDGTGKTTIARKLCHKHNLRYIHFGAPRSQDDIDTAFTKYCELLLYYDNFVMDRSWYSDLIYGEIMRGNKGLTKLEVHILEALADRKHAEILYCTAALEIVQKRLDTRGEDYVPDTTIPKIYNAYQTLFARSNIGLPVKTLITATVTEELEKYE